MKLLVQKVDGLGLIITKYKFKAIIEFNFSATLFQLKFYIGLTGYMRRYIFYYIVIVEPLKKRKAMLNQKLKFKN